MKALGIIPARYGSTRFPGKPLADIAGISMIQRVYEGVSASSGMDQVVVATDDDRILDHVERFGGKAVMTSRDHLNGTSRCLEALEQFAPEFEGIVINIQGDEPLVSSREMDALTAAFEDETCRIATLACPLTDPEGLLDPNMIKVVCRKNGDALYFSRAAIPFLRGEEAQNWLNASDVWMQHIGLYAFRTEVLKTVTQLPFSTLEKTESLEQLRWMDNGYSIRVIKTEYRGQSVDCPKDVEKITHILKEIKA